MPVPRTMAAQGRADGSLKLQEEALALARKVNGPEHPKALSAINNPAMSYAAAGRWDQALKLLDPVHDPVQLFSVGPG